MVITTKRFIVLLLILGFAFVANYAFATPGFDNAKLSSAGTERTLVLPLPAIDNSPVISLGSAHDPQSGKVVDGYAIIHYKEGFGHKPKHNPGGGPGGGGDTKSSCFAFLAKDAKWKGTPEPWVVNAANSRGLVDTFVFANLAGDIIKWEDAASTQILGDGALVSTLLAADTASPDGVNETYFADISSPGAIAVTIVWGIFGGPPFARELVEWDMIIDDVDYDWSSTGEAGKMDFENIVTHELGHAVGMGHPDNSCTEETMYAFADFGEIKKRTLEAGDIAGVAKLY